MTGVQTCALPILIINSGMGKHQEIIELSNAIIDDIHSKYGVALEREVNILC